MLLAVSCWRCQLPVALFMKLSPGGQSSSQRNLCGKWVKGKANEGDALPYAF